MKCDSFVFQRFYQNGRQCVEDVELSLLQLICGRNTDTRTLVLLQQHCAQTVIPHGCQSYKMLGHLSRQNASRGTKCLLS